MKTLVVYYSLDGYTKLIAEGVANAIGADTLRLELKKGYNYKGFFKYVIGGFQAKFRKKPELLPINKNPKDYDLIIIGTPIWAGTYVPAVGSFLAGNDLRGKKTALFACFGGSSGNTFEELKAKLPGSIVMGAIDFKHADVKDPANTNKAANWAKEIIAKC